MQLIGIAHSESIQSQQRAEHQLTKRRTEVGINPDSRIEIKFYNGKSFATSARHGDVYLIELGGRTTLTDLDHELCHIKSGDLELIRYKNSVREFLLYLVFYEPRATLCQTASYFK